MNKTIPIVIATSVMYLIPTGMEASSLLTDTQVVKSSTGLCHDKGSSYRNDLQILPESINVYESLTACIKAGGRLSDTQFVRLNKSKPAEEIEALRSLQNKEESIKVKSDEANQKFFGINWGLGLAFTGLGTELVHDVSIEDGIIRVNHQGSDRALAMVESHYFMTTEEKDYGHGPFMAIGLVGDEGIDPLTTYGLGYMWGWKRTGGAWNIGVGYFIDTKAKTLRGGFKDGMVTTVTDPDKLTIENDESGWMIMFSATW